MTRIGVVAATAAVLTACGGPPAEGQPTPAQGASPIGINAYEVSTERLFQSRAAAVPDSGWIQVSGTGSVQIAPDRARISFAMETRAETASEAAASNADAMDAVLQAIRAGNFEGLVLSTYGYALRPEYAPNNNRQTREIISYMSLNNVGATLDDVDAVGRVLDVAIGAGANRVSSISFYRSDTEAARAEALAQAVRNARAQAEVIAESLGYRLGPPLEINGGAQPLGPRAIPMVAEFRSMAASTPIEVGAQTVTANVSIRFALGPELGG